MKKYNFSKIFANLGRLLMVLTFLTGVSACDDVIYNYGDDCDPEQETPTPSTDIVKIYVRSNPGGGGMSQVRDVANESNSAETEEGIYVSIDVAKNGAYTLTAVETNPEYEFVRWHDDTNDGDLTEGMKVISNIKAEDTNKYTAIFRKIEEPEPEPEPGSVRIYVRTNPGSGGTSRVYDVADKDNSAETSEGIYVSIDVQENGAYTLAAEESNSKYEFVKWHDDTNDSDLTAGMMEISNIKAESSNRYTAIFREIEEPEPEPEPGIVRISVRTNPGGGGTSKVHDVDDTSNSAETEEGIYTSIEIEENGTYTLTAAETNPEYEFVKWHDDTNEIDLTEGKKVISNIKAEASNRYTAIFKKIEKPAEPALVKIFVRATPAGGGTSKVHEVADALNRAETDGGIYVTIEVEENGTYTLTAEESNPEYEFVRWHDDTNDSDLTEGMKVIPNIKAVSSNKYTAIFRLIEKPEPEPEPGIVRISVKSNPGGGGTSKVFDDADTSNSAETEEGLYTSIEVEEDGTYTLTAEESNPEYEFVRWHDDTNDSDLTEGKKVISNIVAKASNQYTAIFRKIEEPAEPEPIVISVRTNPGSGGTSRVHEVGNTSNAAQTQEGIYVSIQVAENGTYTLTATESNPDYEFVRWHDDTNDGNLTEGKMVITDIVAKASNQYTAIFKKKGAPEPSDPTDPDAPVEEGYYVKFVFDRNMQDANAVHRVNSVDLYVFNTSGYLVKRYQETRPLSEDYLMELTDLPAGTYELVAWCGLYNNSSHFTVPTVSRNVDATCTMATSGGVQNKNLNALYHGRRGNGYVDDNRNTGTVTYTAKTDKKQIHTVYLTKDTNNIMLTLQHRKDLEFDKDRFVVTMEDDNNRMSHTNQISDASNVTYKPYRTAMGYTTGGSSNQNTGNFMLVELSTARLMATHNPVINVYDTKDNKTIFSIPLVKWALQFRSANHKDNWGEQEYLDREDNYNLMLWMDSSEGDGWFGAQIEINDWHVVDDSMDAK